MIITVPTCNISIRSSVPVVEINIARVPLNFFAEIKEYISIVTDWKVRGPPLLVVNSAYVQSVVRGIFKVG